MTTATVTLVPDKRKSPLEAEIERLGCLTPHELNGEDLRHLKRIRDCRSSVLETEATLADLKEVYKLRKESLADAIFQASNHFDNRQMALNFGGAN